MVHRIRSLIEHLDHAELRANKLLPKPLFTGVKRGGSFPLGVTNYSAFGMFIDRFVRKVLALQHNLEADVKHTKMKELYNIFIGEKGSFTDREKRYYREMAEFIEHSFEDAKEITFEPEWGCGEIVGHPDLIIDGVIYDVKMSGLFSRMRIKTTLQLLSYYCLAKKIGVEIHSVGVILPAQKIVLRERIDGWEWKGFWKKLRSCVDVKIGLMPDLGELIVFQNGVLPYLGHHVAKKGTVHNTIAQLDWGVAWQIFFGGNCTVSFKVTDADLAKVRECTDRGFRLYIHAPYTLNLSKREDDNWVVEALGKYLTSAGTAGCKGVVIHCGVKKSDVDRTVAYENMYESIIQAVDCVGDTPLLIETSAGETGELLSDVDEFITFYHSLGELKSKVGVCVDTCHVFSAGYSPMEFILRLKKADVPINLVHYNDCKKPQGCRKDLHASPGQGYIGLSELIQVGFYCRRNGIDMVCE